MLPIALLAIAGALGAFAIAPAKSPVAAPAASEGAEADACVVASWDDGRHALTTGGVRALAAAIAPSPAGDEASRWALDVHLAAWDRGEAVSPAELLGAHRAWLDAHGFDLDGKTGDPKRLRAERASLHARARVVPGPCFPSTMRRSKPFVRPARARRWALWKALRWRPIASNRSVSSALIERLPGL